MTRPFFTTCSCVPSRTAGTIVWDRAIAAAPDRPPDRPFLRVRRISYAGIFCFGHCQTHKVTAVATTSSISRCHRDHRCRFICSATGCHLHHHRRRRRDHHHHRRCRVAMVLQRIQWILLPVMGKYYECLVPDHLFINLAFSMSGPLPPFFPSEPFDPWLAIATIGTRST